MFIFQADAVKLPLADKSVDLVFSSPPYMDCRTYGIAAQRDCNEWVQWMLTVTREACRVSCGLVLWVCAGVTRKHCYWPGPEGLAYEWWKQGGQLWRPAFWHRVGIPGSGGKQWLRADIEYVLAFKGEHGPIPWAANTINGHRPKWAPGGPMSYRDADGARRNDKDPWGKRGRGNNLSGRNVDGTKKRGTNHDLSGPSCMADENLKAVRRCTRGKSGGDTMQEDAYTPPVMANPGVKVRVEEDPAEQLARWLAAACQDESPNCIEGIKVGGGLMGHELAHANEAPFPQKLAEWFIRGWCPPGGVVLDCFSGSGTTVAAAVKLGRKGIGCDLRFSQCELGRRRCSEVGKELF